jgi:bile acid:Na+ symporter, BASS family
VDSMLLIANALLGALAMVMFGLGLSLSVADFSRLARYPKAVVVALLLQLVALPAVCYGICLAFSLPATWAIGLMLLAASPGGISANLFSHLFRGDVAMNISLTALNTAISIVTMPLLANWAISQFASSGQVVPMQLRKVAEVIVLVLIPVLLGMLVAARSPHFAQRMERPVKIFSALVLATVTVLSIAKEWSAVTATFGSIGPAVLAFNLASLLAGYFVSRASGLDQPMATAISYEVGIHNSTLAIFLAVGVLGSFELALPAAVYSVVMYLTAPLFGAWLVRQPRARALVRPAQ